MRCGQDCLSQPPPLLRRATRSSCSSTTETPPWCPCGCAGRWRRGGARRGPLRRRPGADSRDWPPGETPPRSLSAEELCWPASRSPFSSAGCQPGQDPPQSGGTGHGGSSAPPLFLCPHIFICKGSSAISILMGIKVLLLCDRLPVRGVPGCLLPTRGWGRGAHLGRVGLQLPSPSTCKRPSAAQRPGMGLPCLLAFTAPVEPTWRSCRLTFGRCRFRHFLSLSEAPCLGR